MIVFNRHFKKTKLITFLLALVYTALPFVLPTHIFLLMLSDADSWLFLSWNIYCFLLVLNANPTTFVIVIGIFCLLLWFLLYNLARFFAWVFKPRNKK
ncbi:MAG TPA: hypothetical protein VKG26_05235 [Bacteroidia bacterium]|nr:hypothetical protein [Bacteroidia bacterium]